MAYLEIFLAIISCILFLSFTSPRNIFLPWNWPFMRMVPTMYLKSHETYDKITQLLAENKGTILFRTSWFTNIDVLVTSDPINVQHIMNTNYAIYQRGSEFRNVFDFLGDAVLNKDLDEWRQEKKFTHAFFRQPQHQKSIPQIIHHTLEKGLIPVLDHFANQNEVLDLQSLFSRYMFDATCIMVSGFDSASLRLGFPETPLLNAMDDIAEAVFYRHILPEKIWKLQRYLKIGREKKLAEASNTFKQILSDYITKKRELSANNQDNEGFDVLKFYLSTTQPSSSSLTTKHEEEDNYLAANLMTLIFAGRDTAGALLTWFFHLISQNPQVKIKILDEIKQNLNQRTPKEHIFSDVGELNKLVYLHSALSESLRLFPAGPFLLRVPNQHDVLPSGHKLNQTTKVMLCSYAMGRMPEIWGKDCGEFKPERWIGENGGVKHMATNTFLAFSSGPWICPGRELAFTRMKAVAAAILHNYDIQVLEGQDICPSVSAILTMKNGLKATVSKRKMDVI